MSNYGQIDLLVSTMLGMSRDYTVARLSTGEYGIEAVDCALRRLSNQADCDHGRGDLVGDAGSLRECQRKLYDIGRSSFVDRGRSSCYECHVRSLSDDGCAGGDGVVHRGNSTYTAGFIDCGPLECKDKTLQDDGIVGNVSADTKSVSEPVCESEHGTFGTGRGKNWDRNQVWKARYKSRKEKKKQMQGNWRHNVNASVEKGKKENQSDVSASTRVGYFSECSPELQRELRETRAAALVEKNKLDVVKARNQLERANAVTDQVRLAETLIHAAKLAEKLKKSTADHRIGGWAETVADSLTKSIAEGAGSSVPSLESVGYGKSALKSSDGSLVSSERIQEYQLKVKILESEFEEHGVYQTYEEDLFMLKQEYGDVALPPEERYKDKYNKELMDKLLHAGVSPMIIDEALGTGVFFSKNF